MPADLNKAGMLPVWKGLMLSAPRPSKSGAGLISGVCTHNAHNTCSVAIPCFCQILHNASLYLSLCLAKCMMSPAQSMYRSASAAFVLAWRACNDTALDARHKQQGYARNS